MASWQYIISGTKTAVATALAAASIADATDMDVPVEDLVGNRCNSAFQRSHQRRAVSVKCLDGQRAERAVVATGYLDLNVTAPISATGQANTSWFRIWT